MLFFPQDDKGVEDARRVFEEGCAEAGVPLLFWREVPVDPHDLGETARACMPTILQAFLGRPDDTPAGDAFERRLYVCRRTIEKKADAEFALRDKIFYVCSMSSRTLLHQHHAQLGTRAPQPFYHPQRRDQHPQGQRQLDPRPRTQPVQPRAAARS